MKKAYPIELTTPIAPRPKAYPLTDLEGPSRDTQRIVEEKIRKFALLLEHYEIAPDDAELSGKLVWSLINDHVPGLRAEEPKRKAGRPKTWTREKKIELFFDVFLELLNGATTDAEALRRLVDKGKISETRKRADSAKHRLDEARKDNVVRVYQHMFGELLRNRSFDEIRHIIKTMRGDSE